MEQGIGNKGIILACNSRSNDVAENDYYATDPIAMEKLCDVFEFHKWIWEPACGEGHLSKVLESRGYDVISTDLIDHNFGGYETLDFLQTNEKNLKEDIVTNPPYKFANEFVKKALDSIANDYYVVFFLKLSFVSSKGRRKFFEENPPKFIYVFSDRVECAKNGKFEGKKGVDYAWFIWQKGWHGNTTLRWL